MLATPPFGASSNKALLRANIKPPVELVVADLAFFQILEYVVYNKTKGENAYGRDEEHMRKDPGGIT